MRNPAERQRTTSFKDTEQRPFRSRRREESLTPESIVASDEKKPSTPEITAPGQVGPETTKRSSIGGGKLASKRSSGDKAYNTHDRSKTSPSFTMSMSGALGEDPGQILYPQLRQGVSESNCSFRSRLEDQRNSSSSRSSQQPQSPIFKDASLQRKSNAMGPSSGGKYSSVISNYVHLIMDKRDALQHIQGNYDAGRSEMDAKKKKEERKRIRKVCHTASSSLLYLPIVTYTGFLD